MFVTGICRGRQIKIDHYTGVGNLPNFEGQAREGDMNCFVVGRQTGQFVMEMKSSVVEYKRSRHRCFTGVDIQIEVDGVFAQNIHRTSERESIGIVGTRTMFGWVFGNVTAEIMQVGGRWNEDCTGH